MPPFRGRYRSWAGRAGSYRRRYHNRGNWWRKRRSYRRGTARRRRTVRRRRRKLVLRTNKPPRTMKCRIKGWWPLLYAFVPWPGIDDSSPPAAQTLGIFTSYPEGDNANGNGVAYGQFSLAVFYDEHEKKRNLWSASNCQFDLARYFGTKIVLWPHKDCDYIFHWDTEYGSTFAVEKKYVHPAIMLNMKHHRICLSVQTRGYWKPVTVWIPRPAIYNNGWEFQTTWAKRGLGFWSAAPIDLLYPWTPPFRTEAGTQGNVPQWWENDATCPDPNSGQSTNCPNWLSYYWKYLNANKATTTINKLALQGPLVKKKLQSSLNIMITYTSYWQWGGEWAQPMSICNPEGRVPGYMHKISDPRGFTRPEDYDPDGIITARALRRLTKRSPERNKSAFSAFQSSTEEETQETSSESGSEGDWHPVKHPKETQEEDQSSGPKMVRHRRKHRRRTAMELLRRLLLKHKGSSKSHY